MLKYRNPQPWDLQVSAILAILTLAFALLPQFLASQFEMLLEIALLILPPGYCLVAALYPRRDDLDGIERMALCMGINIALVLSTALALRLVSGGMELSSIAIVLAVFVLALTPIAYFRRWALPRRKRFVPGFGLRKYELLADRPGRAGRAPVVLLAISIIISISALGYMVMVPEGMKAEGFTEFYVLGPDGKADSHIVANSGDVVTAFVGVRNCELRAINYTLRLALNNSELLTKNARLEDNATWDQPVNFVLREPGAGQNLQFLLYNGDGDSEPYLVRNLVADVSEPDEPQSSILSVEAQPINESQSSGQHSPQPSEESSIVNANQTPASLSIQSKDSVPTKPIVLGTGSSGSGGGKGQAHSSLPKASLKEDENDEKAKDVGSSAGISTPVSQSEPDVKSTSSFKSSSAVPIASQVTEGTLDVSISLGPQTSSRSISEPNIDKEIEVSGLSQSSSTSGLGAGSSEFEVEKEIDSSNNDLSEVSQAGSQVTGGNEDVGKSTSNSQEASSGSQAGEKSSALSTTKAETPSEKKSDGESKVSSESGISASSSSESVGSKADSTTSGSSSSSDSGSDSSTSRSSTSGGFTSDKSKPSSIGSSSSQGEKSSDGGDWKSNSEIDRQIDSLMSHRGNKAYDSGPSAESKSDDIKIVSGGGKQRAVLGKGDAGANQVGSGPKTPVKVG
jgi:uncharacterized membrane protein